MHEPEITPDDLAARLTRWERLSRIKNYVIAALVALSVLLSVGWLNSATNHADTRHNGKVADCRGRELARTLDQFKVLVSPHVTQAERDRAALALERLPTLVARYRDCLTP